MIERSLDQESETYKNICNSKYIKDSSSLNNSHLSALESNYLFWENIAFILAPLNIIIFSVIQGISEKDNIYMKASIYGLAFSITNLGVIYKWRDALYDYNCKNDKLNQGLEKEESNNQYDVTCDEYAALVLGECYPEDMLLSC